MVITVAKAQAGRGDPVPPNTAMALVFTIERLGSLAAGPLATANPEQLPASLEPIAKMLFEQSLPIIDHAIAQATAADTERIMALTALAEDMLASFTRTDSGHSARVGQVQIAKWRKVLDGEP
jgi:hypothetical protein